MANVLVDTAFLIAMFDGAAKLDENVRRRVEHFQTRMAAAGNRIIVPTPALAEFLCGAGRDGPRYLEIISRSRHFQIVSFDERAAIELAAAHLETKAAGMHKSAGTGAPWQKVKVDRQIVAIGVVCGVTTVYSDDTDIPAYAAQHGLGVINFENLPDPPAPEPSLFDQLD